jgi:hypothetical protein
MLRHSSIKPLQRIPLLEDRPIHPIIPVQHLFSMYTMDLVFPLIKATPIRSLLRGAKDTNMNVRVARSRNPDLREQVQSIRRSGYADSFEIIRGEGRQIRVGQVFDGAEVFGLVL